MAYERKPRPIGRRILCIAAVLLAGSTAFATWWMTSLVGLPDVGDPFDVAAFSRPIPDDSNAFILYKKAASILPKEPDEPANYDWKTASPVQLAWFERSQEALKIWRAGTDRPDALYINPADLTFETKLDVAQKLRSFGRLALLHESRLEDAGDFDEALGWSLALLRASRHCGTRGTFIERLIGTAMHRWASTRLIRWAADSKVDARLLRRALDAVIAADAMTAPNSDGLKVEYLSLIRSIADPDLMSRVLDDWGSPDGNQAGPPGLFDQRRWNPGWTAVRRRAINDPERSRRVIRMVFANWLAYADLQPSQRPPKVIPGSNLNLTGPAGGLLRDLFIPGDDAPPIVRALPPKKLAGWFASTVDAKAVLPAFIAVQNALARERLAQDVLLFTLANELYKREHGRYPEKNDELVGPYLKALPPGYAAPK